MVSIPVTVGHKSTTALFGVNGLFCYLEESMQLPQLQHVISIFIELGEFPEQKMNLAHAVRLTYKHQQTSLKIMSDQFYSQVEKL